MENCSICNSDYKKAFKSDHLKPVKHLENLNQYYYKNCNKFMPLSDKLNHLNSDQHKNKTKQQPVWCEGCGKYISDKTRHFQSEIHTLRSRNNREDTQISQDTQNIFGNTASPKCVGFANKHYAKIHSVRIQFEIMIILRQVPRSSSQQV